MFQKPENKKQHMRSSMTFKEDFIPSCKSWLPETYLHGSSTDVLERFVFLGWLVANVNASQLPPALQALRLRSTEHRRLDKFSRPSASANMKRASRNISPNRPNSSKLRKTAAIQNSTAVSDSVAVQARKKTDSVAPRMGFRAGERPKASSLASECGWGRFGSPWMVRAWCLRRLGMASDTGPGRCRSLLAQRLPLEVCQVFLILLGLPGQTDPLLMKLNIFRM